MSPLSYEITDRRIASQTVGATLFWGETPVGRFRCSAASYTPRGVVNLDLALFDDPENQSESLIQRLDPSLPQEYHAARDRIQSRLRRGNVRER